MILLPWYTIEFKSVNDRLTEKILGQAKASLLDVGFFFFLGTEDRRGCLACIGKNPCHSDWIDYHM